MSKFNADTIYEPIEIQIGGIDYEVAGMSDEMFDSLETLLPEDKNKIKSAHINQQLELLTKAPGGIFSKICIFKKIAAINYIIDKVQAGVKGPDGSKKDEGTEAKT